MKIIIAGGRDFRNYSKLEENVDRLLKELDIDDHEVHFITGGARGADRLGHLYAQKNGFKRSIIKAKWDKHGKAAGPIRNAEMAEIGDILIAFWDQKSRGTNNMINQMNKLNKTVHTIFY